MFRLQNAIIFYLISFTFEVSCARILCIIPTPSKSHQIVMRSLVEGLAARGHELVVGTTDPSTEKLENVEEIDFRFAYKLWEEHLNFNKVDADTISVMIQFTKALNAIIEKEMTHPKITEILNNPNEEFDLVIVEYTVFPLTYSLSLKYKAPLIGIVSLEASIIGHDEMGNFPQHSMFPDSHFTPFVGQLSLLQRIQSTAHALVYRYIYYEIFVKRQDELVKKIFGSGYPSGSDVYKYVDLLFVNAHPALGFARPVVPRMIDITGVHMKPVKQLESIIPTVDKSSNSYAFAMVARGHELDVDSTYLTTENLENTEETDFRFVD